MIVPRLEDMKDRYTKPLLFAGLNKNEFIEDIDLSDGKNLDSERLPGIHPRRSYKVLKTLTTPKHFMMVNGKLVYVDGTNFYYDGVVKGTVTAGPKSMVDFNGRIVIFPDKKYYDFIDDTFGTFTCPYDIDYVTVHYNRIFGIKGNNVYASKVGEYNVWDDYSGTELNSWAADVYGPGDFTGITTYQDHVVFFKKDQMYELYGYTPSQFRILETAKAGCINNQSMTEIQGVLYFMSHAGVMAYSGGVPRNMTEKLNLGVVTSSSIGSDGRKLYISTDNQTYIYDTLLQTFMPYMDQEATHFSFGNNSLYALLESKEIVQIDEGTGKVSWEAVTKRFDEGIFLKKSVSEIRLKATLAVGSEVNVYLSVDDQPYELFKSVVNRETYHMQHRESYIKIPLPRCSYYQIKITGYGEALVYGEREFRVGSEKL